MAKRSKSSGTDENLESESSTRGIIDGNESESSTDGTIISTEKPVDYDGDWDIDYPNGRIFLESPAEEKILTYVEIANGLQEVDFINQEEFMFVGYSGEHKVFRKI